MNLKTEILKVDFPLEFNSEVGTMTRVRYAVNEGMVWNYKTCLGIDLVYDRKNDKILVKVNEDIAPLPENIPYWFLHGHSINDSRS